MQATRSIHYILIAVLCALHCACGDGSEGSTTSSLPAADLEPTATREPHPPQPAPTAATTPSAPPTGVGGCASETQETHYCLTFSEGALAVIGLESGALCEVTSTDAPLPLPYLMISMAWVGEHVYVCNENGLLRIALSNGTWELAGSPCEAVAAQDGGLLVNRGLFALLGDDEIPALAWYADFDAVANGTPQRVYSGGLWSTMTAQGDRMFTAWHSADTIDVYDLATDAPAGTITLEDHDDWIQSLSATADDHLMLIGGIFSDRLVVFDVHDGRQVARIDLEQDLAGLACVSNLPPRDPPTATPTPTPQTNVTAEPTATPCSSFNCPELCGRPQPPPVALHELPDSIANTSCVDGPSSNYVTPVDLLAAGAAEELHVIAASDGKGDPGFRNERQGVIDVVVQPRPKPVALALAAYGRTRWRISLQPGAILSRVIVQGYEPQIVDGVAAVPILQRDPLQSCGAAYRWEVDGNGAFSPMIADLRAFTGLVESSYQGCYKGDRFEVPHWSGEPPAPPAPLSGDEMIDNRDVEFAGCEHILAESGRCLTRTPTGIALLGMDSGALCPVVMSTAPMSDSLFTSIAWRGEIAYVCSYEGLIRISLRDGEWRHTHRPCGTITSCDGDLLFFINYWDGIEVYETLSDVFARMPSQVYPAFFHSLFAKMACGGDRLFATVPPFSEIVASDLATGEELPSPPLSPAPNEIESLAATDAGQIAIAASSGPYSGFLSVYDAESGDLLRKLQVWSSFSGLSCISQ